MHMTEKLNNKSICVLGMHRSGTSAVSRAINLLGVYIGEETRLIPPDEDINPKGYWEHQQINSIHEEILNALSRSWNDIYPMQEKWWEHKEINQYREQIIDLLKEEFSDKPLWGWKEPRTCLMIPLWNEIAAQLNIDINYLIVIRNPIDVANSLNKRDGLSLYESILLWQLYTLSALEYTKGYKRTVIQYDKLLTDWRSCLVKISDTFDIAWPENESSLKEEMDGFLDINLRHSRSNLEDLTNLKIPGSIGETYRLCLKAEMDSGFLDSDEFSTQVRKLLSDYEVYSLILTLELRDALEDKNKKIRIQGEKIRKQDWKITKRDETIKQKENNLQEMKKTIDNMDEKISVQNETIEKKEKIISDLTNTLSWRFTKPLRQMGNLISSKKSK